MKLSIGIPVMNQFADTLRCLKQIYATASHFEKIYLVDNGSQPETVALLGAAGLDSSIINKIVVIRNEQNVGVRPALNQIWQACEEGIIAYTHNDVEFFEPNWDLKILETFQKHPEAGIVGAYGAKGLGVSNIYQVPYELTQLARGGCVSDCPMDQKVHGFRNLKNDFENVAVFDGFFMAIKKELLDKTQGFSDILPIHHSYDNLICIQSLENGYENILIPLKFNHLGGHTDTGQDWTKGTGMTKQRVHETAHPPLYEYGRGKLPIWVEDIFDDQDRIVGYQLFMNHKLVKEKIYE